MKCATAKLIFLLLPLVAGKEKYGDASLGTSVEAMREERVPSSISEGLRHLESVRAPSKTKTIVNMDSQEPLIDAHDHLRHRHLKRDMSPRKLALEPELTNVGNNGIPISAFPLGLCEGDCDKDTECEGDFVCFMREDDSIELVPGCTGSGIRGKDYCTVRPWSNYLAYVGNTGRPSSAYPLGFCEGDCDVNADCDDGLYCFRRREYDPVPGCEGLGTKGKDYCIPKPEVCDSWVTVVNNADEIPDTSQFEGKNFSSYNAPSVNVDGFVVFRARSTGGGNPSTGIFGRVMYGVDKDKGIVRQAGRRTTVPAPNNLATEFIEFPSFPRMSRGAYHIAFRGNHDPVWLYGPEGNETRIGNTGLYFNLDPRDDDDNTTDTSENLHAAMAKLGSVPEFSNLHQVPGLVDDAGEVLTGVLFDVFPGAPAIDDEGFIGTKGNYNRLGTPQTGVFYRNLTQGTPGVELGTLHVIANSETTIPDPIEGLQRTKVCSTPNSTFGSTAPPSVAMGRMVFLGLDNEDAPMCGGIYEAPMDFNDYPTLTTLVDLETEVPEEGGELFAGIGDVISYDGNAVVFWGSWGNGTKDIKLCCPTSGNKDRRDFCTSEGVYNDSDLGDKNTIFGNSFEGCESGAYQERTVPEKQGFFVYNTVEKSLRTVAKLTADDENDMVFWTYSGKPPAAGPGDESDSAEPPRWRSSATAALSQYNNIVYKQMVNGFVGIWHWNGSDVSDIIIETGQECTDLDDAGTGKIESLAIERDGFRGARLVIAAACAEEVVDGDAEQSEDGDWGGIYLKTFCPVV